MRTLAFFCLFTFSTLVTAQQTAIQPRESWETLKSICMNNPRIQGHLDTFGIIVVRYNIKLSRKGIVENIYVTDISDLSKSVISEITELFKKASWKAEKMTRSEKKSGLEFNFYLEKRSHFSDSLSLKALWLRMENDSAISKNPKFVKLPNGDSVKIRQSSAMLPSYPGGDAAFIELFMHQLEYPKKCESEGISGYVQLYFNVDPYGNIKNIEIEKDFGTCPEFGAEAKRVLNLSGKWIPSSFDGHYIEMKRSIPISITIN